MALLLLGRVYQNLFKRGRATTVGLIQTATSVRVPMVGIGRHLKDLEILFFLAKLSAKFFRRLKSLEMILKENSHF